MFVVSTLHNYSVHAEEVLVHYSAYIPRRCPTNALGESLETKLMHSHACTQNSHSQMLVLKT